MNQSKQLYELQQIDSERDRVLVALGRVERLLGDDEALAQTRLIFTSECQNLIEVQSEQRTLEWEINELDSKKTRLKEKIYGGTVVNPKELVNYEREIENVKLRLEERENKLLEVMDKVEVIEASVKTRENQIQEMEREWQCQQEKLSTEKIELDSQICNLDQRRQMLITTIEPANYDLYDLLSSTKGSAVARIEQGLCQGCRINVSMSEWQRVRGGDIVQCSSCGRLLFLD